MLLLFFLDFVYVKYMFTACYELLSVDCWLALIISDQLYYRFIWLVSCVWFQEVNAEYIESNLLNQLRLITAGHVFPVWVHKTCIFIKAGEFSVFYWMIFLCDNV